MTKLFKLRKIIDAKSKGFDEYEKVSNNKLKSSEVEALRKEFNSQWTVISHEVVDKYLEGIGKPKPYHKNKKAVDSKITQLARSLTSQTNNFSIKIHDEWGSFLKDANTSDVVDVRIQILKKFFEMYRDEFIKVIPATEIPAGFRDKLREFVQLYSNVTGISDTLKVAKKLKALPSDYYHSKQQVHSVYRCDFIIALRVLEKILEKFNIKLNKKFKEMADVAKIFENGISAFTIGKKTINLLIAPEVIFIKNPARNQDGYVLDSIKTAAYKSTDTGDVHFIKGIYINKPLWIKTKQKKLNIMEIRGIENMEQRRVITEALGPDPFENDPTAIKSKITKKGNRLITLPKAVKPGELGGNSEAIDLKILHYTDPSTGREYNSFVPPRLPLDSSGRVSSNSHVLSDPDEAMAWKFGKSKDDYYNNMQDEG